MSDNLNKVISTIEEYLRQTYTFEEINKVNKELEYISRIRIDNKKTKNIFYTYDDVQRILSSINEKGSNRKSKGVYYTPNDVVKFILFNSVKLVSGKRISDSINAMNLKDIPYKIICYGKTIFDPTCGAGEFLLSALELKFSLLEINNEVVTKRKIKKIIQTIHGNDVNSESTTIAKLRLLLSVLNKYGVNMVVGLAEEINRSFTNYDYLSINRTNSLCYDIIVGNPPYVEDKKSGLDLEQSYGNIYANVLDNAAKQLNNSGVLGFIIPLSYVSTPRMWKIRRVLYNTVPEQYILNYSDRPDCLFTSVHQKLSILFAKKNDSKPVIWTGNYTYWYKEERKKLFSSSSIVINQFVEDKFIPKIGSELDEKIYKKIITQTTPFSYMFDGGGKSIYLNMRATFWIKAFIEEHEGKEYKEFKSSRKEIINYAMCLLNSSLFWWYWICVSDCWHITRKELDHFKVPSNFNVKKVSKLANNLENKLEETKVFVGTRQTVYEYKHRLCMKEIHEIDNYINQLFWLTEDEKYYIKKFSLKYRVGGGAKIGRN